MVLAHVFLLLGLLLGAHAIPPKKRQASVNSCSCPPDVTITATTTATTTTSTTSYYTNLEQSIADDVTITSTYTSVFSRTRAGVKTVTTTIADSTSIVSGTDTTYVTVTTTASSTITTCIISAYVKKRQVSNAASPTSAPSTTAFSTTATNGIPVTCTCRLVSSFGFSTSTSTSPATCSCPPVGTTTTTLTSTYMVTESYESDIDVSTTFTPTDTDTSTVTSTTTIYTVTATNTVSVGELTVTSEPTATTTSTYTPTFISCPTANTSCNNQGIQWAAYHNVDSSGNDNSNTDTQYTTFEPAFFKNITPYYTGVTTTLGGFVYPSTSTEYIQIYNSSITFNKAYIALNHIGYIFAQVSGTYTFSLSESDDIALIWVGQYAYSGYTRANANALQYYTESSVRYSTQFTAGKYYPFRIYYANAQGAMAFQASLRAPDGRIVLTSNSGPSDYLVQYSCDGTSAPPFPPFGQET